MSFLTALSLWLTSCEVDEADVVDPATLDTAAPDPLPPVETALAQRAPHALSVAIDAVVCVDGTLRVETLGVPDAVTVDGVVMDADPVDPASAWRRFHAADACDWGLITAQSGGGVSLDQMSR